jgi:hypothetical protein
MITRDPNSCEPRPVTAQVRIFIAGMPEVVFDYFADLRNEPQYNRQVSGITKTSPGPVDKAPDSRDRIAALGRSRGPIGVRTARARCDRGQCRPRRVPLDQRFRGPGGRHVDD